MKSMKILSSKKKSRLSSALGVVGAAYPPIRAARSVDTSELLQLRLENSDLRNRLENTRSSDTDVESKSELLKLLEEQTSQTEFLQSKCDELHRGFVEIDKERKALRKSADDARGKAQLEVEQTRDECDRKEQQSQRHLRMREKEVGTLAERTREQERRIETVVVESNERQAKVEQLEDELEELMGMFQEEKANRIELEGECKRVIEVVRGKEEELGGAELVRQELEKQLEDVKNTLEDEGERWRLKEERLNTGLQEKDTEKADMLQEQQLAKMDQEQAIQALKDEQDAQRAEFSKELHGKDLAVAKLMAEMQETKQRHHQALQAKQDELEAQRADFDHRHRNMTELYQNEKTELINDFQSQINDQSTTITNLTSDIDELQSNHTLNVAEMETFIRKCQEGTRSIEKTYAESLDTISQLQQEFNEHRSSNQIAQEELKAANNLLEEESRELAQELDGTKVQLASTGKMLNDVQSEYTTLSQEHESLQQNHLALANELNMTKGQLGDTNGNLGNIQTQLATLQSQHVSLQQSHSQQVHQISTLESEMELMGLDHDEAVSQKANEMSAMGHELKEEKSVSNKLRAQLRDLNIQLKEDGATRVKEVNSLTRELEEVSERLSAKEMEASDLHCRYQAEVERHANEMESLHTDHAAQIMVIETGGADVVSDLEDAIGELEKELAGSKSEHEKVVATMRQEMQMNMDNGNMEQEHLQQILAVKEREIMERELAHDQDVSKMQHDIEVKVASLDIVTLEKEHLEHSLASAERMIMEERLARDQVVGKLQDDMQATVSSMKNIALEKERLGHALVEKERKIAEDESAHEQVVGKLQDELQSTEASMNTVKLEKERLERSLAELEKRGTEQGSKIKSLTAYAKEKKEDLKKVKTELVRVKHSLENSVREREDAVSAVQSEMVNARLLHEREMADLQHSVDGVRAELSVATERLAAEDNELTRARTTLSERTNLLRDMVNQTTAYQGDYEREHARASQLDEAAKSYKKQLAEARDIAQRLENEIHDKDTHYCDAIRNERQQRKAMEPELESSRKSMEDALRKNAAMEKENSSLRDKVSRQEKYIGRLQADKGGRRTSNMPNPVSQVNHGRTSKSSRPSSAGARSRDQSPLPKPKDRMTSKHRTRYATNENDRPNVGRFGFTAALPQSPDELGSLLE